MSSSTTKTTGWRLLRTSEARALSKSSKTAMLPMCSRIAPKKAIVLRLQLKASGMWYGISSGPSSQRSPALPAALVAPEAKITSIRLIFADLPGKAKSVDAAGQPDLSQNNVYLASGL
jgi:hypothetical protein